MPVLVRETITLTPFTLVLVSIVFSASWWGFLFQVFLSCLITLTSSICSSSLAPCCLLLWALIPFLHPWQKSSFSACVSWIFCLILGLIVSCFRHSWFTWTKMLTRIPRMFSMLVSQCHEPWQVERSHLSKIISVASCLWAANTEGG